MLDRIGSLNSLAQQLGAKGDMLYPATCTQSQAAGDTTIDISEDGYYYADYVTCNADSLTVSRDDGWTQQYGKTTHRYLLDLGECKAGTKGPYYQFQCRNDRIPCVSPEFQGHVHCV